MLKPRSLILFLICASTVAARAESELVTLGDYRAHRTRILARYRDQAQPQLSAPVLQSLKLKPIREYSLVPGLVLLDSAPPDPGAVTKLEVQSDEAQLLRRISLLRASGLFAYVEPDYAVTNLLTPADTAFTDGTLWALRNVGQNGGIPGADIDAVRAWDITTGGTNVIVAVIDTGIRYTHKDLEKQMWRNLQEVPGNGVDDDGNGFVDDYYGINALLDNGNPIDDDGHGTHVAGTIGAAANDNNPHVGVAWSLQLMACKFIRSGNQGGFGLSSDAIQSINYAVAKGAKILNNSWGGGPFVQAEQDAITAARGRGVLFVAAAGNDGTDNDGIPHYPASYRVDNVIAVAAIDRFDRLGDFSNYGKTSVHLGAPGVDIFSTVASTDTSYATFDGTSMAAPHVSGVAALILARFPGATLAELRERILRGTVPIPALRDTTRTGGRLNAFNALNASADGVLELTIDPPSGSAVLGGASIPVFVTVNDLFAVTNATVNGTLVGPTNTTNIVFRNNGQTPDVVTNDEIYSAMVPIPAGATSVTLTVTVTAPGKSNATSVVIWSVSPPPPNDYFTNAAKIPADGAFGDHLALGTNKFATLEFGEPRHAGVGTVAASIWWNWSPAVSGRAIVDTAGSTFDTVLAVYRGNTMASLTPVASVDDVAGKTQGFVMIDVTAGVTYRIAIAGATTNEFGTVRLRVEPNGQPDTNAPSVRITAPISGQTLVTNRISVSGTALDPKPNASGVSEVFVQVNSELARKAIGTTNWSTIVLLQEGFNAIKVFAVDFAGNTSPPDQISVNFTPQIPLNDIFNNSILIQTNGTTQVSSATATKEFGEPNHGGNEGGKSVWWSFRAPSDGVLFLSTSNSTFDTLLGLYTGDRVNALQTVASNDDAVESVKFSKLTQAVRSNQLYRIAVDGYAASSGQIVLETTFTPSQVYSLILNSGLGGSVRPASGLFPSNATVVLVAQPTNNYDFVGFEGSASSIDNPFMLVVRSNMTITARFRARTFSDDFESGGLSGLPFTSPGDVPWQVQNEIVSLGQFAARSGEIGNNQSSSLQLSSNFRAGPASFDFKVSSEPAWDKLEFLLNGTVLESWSGEVGWLTYEFSVPAGANTLVWRYSKDVNGSGGLDAAFIDNLNLPIFVATNASSRAVLSLRRLFDGTFQLRAVGQPNQQYVVQVSTNLLRWDALSTNIAVNGSFQFVDPVNTSRARFYRVIIP